MIYAEALSAHALSGRSVGEEEGRDFGTNYSTFNSFFFLFLPISQQPSINCKWRGILQHVQQRQNPRRRIRDRQGEHGARRVKAKKLSIFPMLSNRKIDEKQQKKINTVAIITRNKRVKTNSHFQIQNIKIHPGKVKLVHSTPRKRG